MDKLAKSMYDDMVKYNDQKLPQLKTNLANTKKALGLQKGDKVLTAYVDALQKRISDLS